MSFINGLALTQRRVTAILEETLRRSIADNRGRWVLFLPVVFGVGIALYFSLSEEPRSAPVHFAMMGLAMVGVLAFSKGASAIARVCLIVTVLLSGLAWAQERAESRGTVFLDRARLMSDLEGRVTWVERYERGPRVYLEDLRNWPRHADGPPPAIRIRLRDADVPEVGARIRLTARLTPPAQPAYPDGYDFARRAWFQGIGAVGFAMSDWAPVAEQSGDSLAFWDRFWRAVNRMRQDIITSVRATEPGTGGAVMAALLTGDRSGIPPDILDDLRAAGLAYLLAISGLHLGLVAGTVFFAMRGVLSLRMSWNLTLPTKKISATVALFAAFGYLFLAGATIPTQRAFLMTALVLIAVLCDRQAISMRLVALAAGLVLILAPETVMGPSFQLSFAAVTALVAVYEGWARQRAQDDPWPRKITRYAFFVGVTTIVAGLATAPFAIHHFGRIAHYSVFANLIAVPIVTFWVMPLGLIALLVMPIGLAEGPLALATFGLNGVLVTADSVAGWPGATGQIAAFPDWGIGAIFLGGLWWAIWRGTLRHAGGVLMVIGSCSQAFTLPPTVILHENGRQAGLVWQEQIWVEAPRSNRFAQRVWSEKTALPIGGSWQDLQSLPDSPLRCGPLGCIFTQSSGPALAFVKDPRAMAEDCRMAQILRLPINPHISLCRSAQIFTPASLRKTGAVALFWDRDVWRFVSVRDRRGTRLWTD